MSTQPNFSTLYRFFDKAGTLLYVGITSSFENRKRNHSGQPWWPEVARWVCDDVSDHPDPLALERETIHREQPRYNRRDNPAREPRQDPPQTVVTGVGDPVGVADIAERLGVL